MKIELTESVFVAAREAAARAGGNRVQAKNAVAIRVGAIAKGSAHKMTAKIWNRERRTKTDATIAPKTSAKNADETLSKSVFQNKTRGSGRIGNASKKRAGLVAPISHNAAP